jgi:hypothetical protein
MSSNNSTGCSQAIAIIGLIGAIITIFGFLTGIFSMQQFFNSPNTPTSPPSLTSTDASATLVVIMPSLVPQPTQTAIVGLESQPTSTVSTAETEEQQVKDVIEAEAKGFIDQDLILLESVWSPDGVLIERSGTPDNLNDDITVRGWPALRQRYIKIFPKRPKSIVYVDLKIKVSGDKAIATDSGSIQDDIYGEDIGIFTLKKTNGKWLIAQYEYGNK